AGSQISVLQLDPVPANCCEPAAIEPFLGYEKVLALALRPADAVFQTSFGELPNYSGRHEKDHCQQHQQNYHPAFHPFPFGPAGKESRAADAKLKRYERSLYRKAGSARNGTMRNSPGIWRAWLEING